MRHLMSVWSRFRIDFLPEISVLRQNVRRRMVVHYSPFIPALRDQHRKARWTRHGFAVFHPGKGVKARDDDGIIAEDDGASFIDHVLVAGAPRRPIP